MIQIICSLRAASLLSSISSVFSNNTSSAHGPVGVAVPVDDSGDELVAGSGTDLILVTFPTGTMGNEVNGQVAPKLGSLYRIDDTFEPVKEITPVTISNGLAWNIEDNTFYYIDTPTHQIAAYDYDPNNNTISNKRIVFDLNKTNVKGLPDGMTIDTNGNLWIALYGGHHVIHVNPKTQELLRKVKIPAEGVTSVAFGGPLLDILYVTTSGHALTAQQRKATPHAGSVFAVKGLGVHGILANSFVINRRQTDEEKIDE